MSKTLAALLLAFGMLGVVAVGAQVVHFSRTYLVLDKAEWQCIAVRTATGECVGWGQKSALTGE